MRYGFTRRLPSFLPLIMRFLSGFLLLVLLAGCSSSSLTTTKEEPAAEDVDVTEIDVEEVEVAEVEAMFTLSPVSPARSGGVEPHWDAAVAGRISALVRGNSKPPARCTDGFRAACLWHDTRLDTGV